MDDLRGRRLAGGTIDHTGRIQTRHVRQDEARNLQDFLRPLFLGDQAFAGEGNACSHGGS
ncbi:hypothetical protein D3C73_1644570 [compost metagenome]